MEVVEKSKRLLVQELYEVEQVEEVQERSQGTGELDSLLEKNRGLRSNVTKLDLELQVLRRWDDTDGRGQELRRRP